MKRGVPARFCVVIKSALVLCERGVYLRIAAIFAAITKSYGMKMFISTLSTCALLAAGCGQEATCETPDGLYDFNTEIIQLSPNAACDEWLATANRTTHQLYFENGTLRSFGGFGGDCDTARTPDGCTLIATCKIPAGSPYFAGTLEEKHSYVVSPDGHSLRGTWETSGTNEFCPHAVVGGAARKVSP